MNEGSLTLTTSIISNNTVNHDGGGIANRGTLTINASDVFGNFGAGGGAIANWPGGEATIQNGTQVHDNSASTGGGLFNYSTLTLADSVVSNNTADYGAGLSNWSGILTITNSNVSGNTASHSGGGIHNQDGGTVTIENGSVITGNMAPSSGGIENWENSTVTISNSSVSNNTGGGSGGGIANWGTLTAESSTIANNSANASEYSSGGGIVNWGGTVILTNSTVSENTTAWGGGIMSYGGSLTLDASTVSGNTVVNGGGGIFIKESATAIIQNDSQITNNSSSYAGGVSSWGSMLNVARNYVDQAPWMAIWPGVSTRT